jgi:hypothetical protein
VRRGQVGHNPRKLTPARRHVLLEAVAKGHSQTAAASIAGISRATLQRELRRSAVLAREIEEARYAAEAYLLNIVIEGAAKNVVWACWLLERAFGYTKRFAAEVTAMTPEQAAALVAAEKVAGMTPDEARAALRENLKLLSEHDSDEDRLKNVTPIQARSA